MRQLLLKRIPAIVLAVMLVVSLLPERAYALSYFDREYFFRVNLSGLNAPAAGEHPDYEIGVLSEYYRINTEEYYGFYDGIAWYDLETGKYLTKDSVFEEGHAYKIYINVRCSGDYRYFLDPCTVVMDGEQIDSNTWDNHTFLTASKRFEKIPTKKVLSKVDISGNIVKGTLLKAESPLASSTDGVESVESVWTRNEETLKTDTTVNFGKYYADLTIRAEDGYLFSWSTKVKVFGEERHVQSLSADGREIHTTSPYQVIECDHAGNTDDAWHYTSDSFGTALTHYKKCTDCGENFAEGEHIFDDGSVSGNETTYTCTVCGYKNTVENGNTAITSLTVNDNPAYVGMNIPINEKPSLRGFSNLVAKVDSVTWYEGDSNTPIGNSDAKFIAGKTYRMELQMSAKDGYYANNTNIAVFSNTWANDVSINTGYATVSNLSNDKKTFTVTFTYKATEPITLSVDMPKIECGMTYLDIVDGVHVTARETKEGGNENSLDSNLTISVSEGDTIVASVYQKKNSVTKWSRTDNGTDATALLSGKLKALTDYKIEVVVDRNSDYQHIDKNSVTIDKKNANKSNVTGTGLSYLASASAYYTTEKAIVDKISVSDIVQPEIGKMPNTTYTLDTPYGLTKDGDLEWNTTKAFTCETEYKATIRLGLAEGYAFADDVSVDYGGQYTIESLAFNDEKTKATVVFAAPVLEHNYGEWIQTKAPTCTEDGTETTTCSNDPTHVKTRIVDPIGHDYKEYTVTKEATCTEPGEEVSVCTHDSSHKYIKTINPKGHSFPDTWQTDADKHWKVCSVCSEKAEESAHTFGTGTVTKAATQTEEGVITYTCTVCSFAKNEAIPKLAAGGDTSTGSDKGTTTEAPKNTATEAKQGDTVTDEVSKASYTVTSTGDVPTVVYQSPDVKNAASVSVPAEVVVAGKTYKVTSVAKEAFKNNKKLKKATIGKNVEVIEDGAFAGCTALKSITIPASVKKIGKNAFSGCKNLKTVTIKTTLLTKKTVGKNAFKGINAKAKVKVPKSKLKAYKSILKTAGIKGKKQKISK